VRSPSSRPLAWLLAGGAAALGGTLWYRWRFPVHRRRREVPHVSAGPATPAVESPGHRHRQRPEEGAGARFHRRYHVDVADPALTAEELMAAIGRDPHAFSPSEIARFEKTCGEEGRLAVGDEFMVHISSPWNGPVRVVEVERTSFTLATLEGHMEAGQIRFSVVPHPTVAGALRFVIESWARSRDTLIDLAYDALGVAQMAQEAMWTFFCEKVAEASGGERLGEIEVLTEREGEEESGEEGKERVEGEER